MGKNDGKREDLEGSPEVMDLPFSQETLALYRRVQQVCCPNHKKQLLMDLAAQFAKEHDSSDETASDDYHVYFEEYEKARLAYKQAALRVGRLAVGCIDTFLESNPSTTVEEIAVANERSVN